MRLRLLIAFIALALVSAWIGWTLRGFIAVDACLDAGGRWQGSGQYCQGAR
jgi:hypothetical protein